MVERILGGVSRDLNIRMEADSSSSVFFGSVCFGVWEKKFIFKNKRVLKVLDLLPQRE